MKPRARIIGGAPYLWSEHFETWLLADPDAYPEARLWITRAEIEAGS